MTASLDSETCSASVIAVLYVIPYHIGQSYNGIQMHKDIDHQNNEGTQGPVSWLDVLEDLVKSPSCKIGSLNYCITLKFGRHISSTAAEVPAKFQSNSTIVDTNLAASRLCKILQ